MSYSGQYLYNALSYDELAQLFVDAYNENFNTSYTPEDLQNTELGTIISIFIQISYQTELAAGGLKDSLIQYLQNKQELEVLPKNATRSGISNSILALDFITAVSEEDP
ncbi:MAG: hypothetical protein CMF19_09330, partial [Idiomarinaceae bacterium]|nr:hypothetical protein [Idiomarinaceae bacterium]